MEDSKKTTKRKPIVENLRDYRQEIGDQEDKGVTK